MAPFVRQTAFSINEHMSSKVKPRRRAAAPAPIALGRQVRRLRRRLGTSLRGFAEKTGFSPSFISQLENGAVSPSLGSLEKIADALGVTLRDFFVPPREARTLVIRRDERQHVTSAWSQARIEALGVAGQRLAAMMVVLEPGGHSGKHPRPQPREQFAFVAEGQVVLTLGGETHQLRDGDSAVIPAGADRLWVNDSPKRCRIVVVSAL
jgi:quercetin dioxygenase-like cupin family protein/DNA-binding XRE family transcriptional regulator